MKQYRIVEQKGKKTGSVSFYIQHRLPRYLWRGYEWRAKYQHHPEQGSRLLEFDTLKEAKEWCDYHTEEVDEEDCVNIQRLLRGDE